jgi:dGTPase
MRTRQDIEKIENKALAPFAMKSSRSWGRLHQENEHASRTCFQRDRDRVVHCEAFRKLEYKTQVFVIYEGDYYRTRLTHTIEVAQLARTIGRNLCLNEDLIEAVALAHDLGHPPFGHAGEEALDQRMKQAGVKEGFNHNQRSFEIVSKFEKRYPDFDGLNLTVEVLVGVLKHESLYDRAGKDLVSEDKAFAKKLMARPCSLEAQVVDKADSLAYLNHDVDDGLTSGCITETDLNKSDLWRRAVSRISKPNIAVTDPMFKYQVVKELIDMQVKDLLAATSERLVARNIRSDKDLGRMQRRLVDFSDGMNRERLYLQGILNEKFYHHWRIERMTSKAKRILNELFDVFLDNPRQLPYDVYNRSRKYSNKELYKVICNYLAAMTDRAALDEYKRLFEPYKKV